jgi:hypothetical protein
MKLNMYKTRHPAYYAKEEFMDVSVIHSLTGMHVVSMDVNDEIITLFKDEFKVRAIPNVQSSESEVDNNNGGTDNNNNNVVNSHNNNEQLQPIY